VHIEGQSRLATSSISLTSCIPLHIPLRMLAEPIAKARLIFDVSHVAFVVVAAILFSVG